VKMTPPPVKRVADAGCCEMVGCTASTEIVTLAVEPYAVALIVADPAPTAVRTPVALTVTAFVLLLTQFVTWLLNGTLEIFAKFARAVACCELPPTMVVFVTETDPRPRNAPAFVFTEFGPIPKLTAIWNGVSGPFQMRNSSMLPFMLASPLKSERPSHELALFTLATSIVVARVLTWTPLA